MRRLLFPAFLLLAAPAYARSPDERIAASVVAGSCPAPQWPATRFRIDGLAPVRIALVIAPDGQVRKASVEQSAGHRLWDDAVIKAFSKCRFLPGRLKGTPVSDVIKMKHIWTLE